MPSIRNVFRFIFSFHLDPGARIVHVSTQDHSPVLARSMALILARVPDISALRTTQRGRPMGNGANIGPSSLDCPTLPPVYLA